MAIKVCNNRGSCWGDDVAAGILYAADNGAHIISISLGYDSPDLLIEPAIDYAVDAGVLMVAAAGNDGPEEGSIDYPASNPKVIAVGASGMFGEVDDWSSRGVNDGDYVIEEGEVEFSAPGVSVESTYNDGCYKRMEGTSMAAPHVSELLAELSSGHLRPRGRPGNWIWGADSSLKSTTKYRLTKSLASPISRDFVLCVGVLCLSDGDYELTWSTIDGGGGQGSGGDYVLTATIGQPEDKANSAYEKAVGMKYRWAEMEAGSLPKTCRDSG
jgi:subtilisin family serine protease